MNKKIGNIGFASLVFFLSQEIFLGVGFSRILNISLQDTWLSLILAFILGFIFLILFFKIINYEKDLNLFDKNKKLFGNKLGKIINFILNISVTIYFMFSLWNLAIYIQNKFLDQTPKFLIMFLFIIPVIYLVSKDIKTIAKVSLICFIIAIIEFILSALGLIGFLEIDNFKPFLNTNLNNVLSSSFIFLSYFLTPFFLLLIVPKNRIDNPNSFNKIFIIFYIIANLEFLIIVCFIISIFGIDYAKLFYYPEFSLLKKISYFDFIEHVENLLSSQWLFSLFMGSVMNLYFIKSYLNNTDLKKEKTKKIIYYVIIFLSLFVSPKLFANTTIEYNFVKDYFIIIYTIPVLILLIIAIFMIKRKKRN